MTVINSRVFSCDFHVLQSIILNWFIYFSCFSFRFMKNAFYFHLTLKFIFFTYPRFESLWWTLSWLYLIGFSYSFWIPALGHLTKVFLDGQHQPLQLQYPSSLLPWGIHLPAKPSQMPTKPLSTQHLGLVSCCSFSPSANLEWQIWKTLSEAIKGIDSSFNFQISTIYLLWYTLNLVDCPCFSF